MLHHERRAVAGPSGTCGRRRFLGLVGLCLSVCSLFFVPRCAADDVDGDAIPDEWETHGVTVTFADGHTRFLDLRAMGASPKHKDLIVWVTWMEALDHSHKPTASKEKAGDGSGKPIEALPLGRVVDAFRNAPTKNPDNTTGINLILIYADGPMPEVPQVGSTDASHLYDWAELEQLASAKIPTAPVGITRAIHVGFFIHQMGGEGLFNSGLSKGIPGREFLVSLGGHDNKMGSSDDQAGTFMHELGHNLGLRHGGAEDTLYKPNYLSVLNYLFQVTGLMIDGTLGHFDYSRQKFDFDETSVDGRLGVSQDTTLSHYGSAEVCGPDLATFRYFSSLSAPIRWNCTDDDPDALAAKKDVNRDGNYEILQGWDDWTHLVLQGAGAAAGVPMIGSIRPRDEFDVRRVGSVLARVRVSQLSAVAKGGGFLVKWSRVPLEAVVAYEVLRTRPGWGTEVVRQTKKAEFLDTTAAPGVPYSYQVRLVMNGFSSESINRVAARHPGVRSLLLENIRSVLQPQTIAFANYLMRTLPSKSVQADPIG